MNRLRWVVVAVGLAAGGCGPAAPVARVDGVLTYGGKPLHGVQVQFLPDPETGARGPRAVGMTDENGRFSLRTDAGEADMIVGAYAVCLVDVAARVTQPAKPKNGQQPTRTLSLPSVSRPRFAPEYATAARSPFQRVAVIEGAQSIELDAKTGSRK